jgi:predicted CopG family antitoxin
MTSKSISIKEEVYKKLNEFRTKNESFSRTIERLLETHLDIMSLAGAWKKIPDVNPALELVEKIVKKIHETENDTIQLI